MKTIFLDFETYHSTKEKYDLRKLSLVEYVLDPRFKVQGVGLKIDAGETCWISGKDVETVFPHINWAEARVVAHNVKFDGAILQWKYGYTPAQWIDTKGMVKAILGSSIPSSSLKDVAEALGLPVKGELKTNGFKELTFEQEEELATYCKRDVDICHDIFYTLLKYVPDTQWGLIDWTVRAFLEPKLQVDGNKCQQVYEECVQGKAELVKTAGVDPIKLRSNPQFEALLKAEGFTVPYKKNTKGKQIPALSIQDKGFLKLLESNKPRLRQLCQARKAVKQTLEETRAQKLYEISKLSPYCFDVIFSGATQTHRFSGGNGCAGNPQNFRRGSELRAAITASKGHTLIVADFSNIELRILAYLTQDVKLMTAIKNKEDVYCKFASEIYGFTVTKQNKRERALGKAAVLGLGYGMGAEKFKATVLSQIGETITDDFAKSVVHLYRDVYKGVPQFWRICEEVLERATKESGAFPNVPFLKIRKDAIALPSGLLMKYKNLRYTWKKMWNIWKKEWVYDRYKSAKKLPDPTKIYGGMLTENICQGLAGEICKEAIQRLIDAGYPPVGQVHDELLVVCKTEDTGKVQQIVQRAMTDPMPWWKELPLEVEIGSGQNWLECK